MRRKRTRCDATAVSCTLRRRPTQPLRALSTVVAFSQDALVEAALAKHQKRFRQLLARRVKMKYAPSVVFVKSHRRQQEEEMELLFKQVEAEEAR